MVSTYLNILNRDNEPTFVTISSKEVIDLALHICTGEIGNLVTNWHVYDEISLSDHRHKIFQVCYL
jgi:hypothetical protein